MEEGNPYPFQIAREDLEGIRKESGAWAKKCSIPGVMAAKRSPVLAVEPAPGRGKQKVGELLLWVSALVV